VNYARLQSRRPSCQGVARDTLLRPNPQKAALLAMDILRMSVPAKEEAFPCRLWGGCSDLSPVLKFEIVIPVFSIA